MTSLYLQLHMKAGTSILEASIDAAHIANKLDVPVSFEFNGVTVDVEPGESPNHVVEEFDYRLKRQGEYEKAAGLIP